MSQTPGRTCPACGTPVPPGQRFCSNCGTDLTVSAPGPASQYGGSSPQQMPYGQPQQQVPPYAQAPGAFNQQPPQPYQQPQKSNPIAEALGALGLLFFLRRYRPGYQARRQSSGCCGCLVALVILLLIFGIPAYVYYHANPNVINQIKARFQQTGNSTDNTFVNSNSNGVTPVTQAPVAINQSVVYAGVSFAIESAQQASIFTDDNNIPASTNGMVRIKFKETNNSGHDVSFYYPDMMHLILPDKSKVALNYVYQPSASQNGTANENWVDFVAPMSDKIDQMMLVLGTSTEAQMSIPLTGKADLSAYQAKTVTLNKAFSYDSLNWTFLAASESFSVAGHQATSGMRYVVLSFKVDNSTSNNKVIGFPEDYMRLKVGGLTSSPADKNMPLYANGNTSGTTGTVTFLVPENNAAYTLIFLAAQNYSNVQVNTDFTI